MTAAFRLRIIFHIVLRVIRIKVRYSHAGPLSLQARTHAHFPDNPGSCRNVRLRVKRGDRGGPAASRPVRGAGIVDCRRYGRRYRQGRTDRGHTAGRAARLALPRRCLPRRLDHVLPLPADRTPAPPRAAVRCSRSRTVRGYRRVEGFVLRPRTDYRDPAGHAHRHRRRHHARHAGGAGSRCAARRTVCRCCAGRCCSRCHWRPAGAAASSRACVRRTAMLRPSFHGDTLRLAPAHRAAPRNVTTSDPYLWLEDVSGQESLDWVRKQNAKSQEVLEADQDFQRLEKDLLAILDSDEKIPYVVKRGPHYYNFWTDRDHQRGIWRRTTLAEYRKANAEWETLLDIDALNEAEGENWVWHGADCLKPADPDEAYERCLIALSRGGADADVTREFDLTTRDWVRDGFFRP